MNSNKKLFCQAIVFHAMDKYIDFEEGYYNLKYISNEVQS